MLVRLLFASLAVALLLAPAVAVPSHPATPAASDADVMLEVRFLIVTDDGLNRMGVDFGNESKSVTVRGTSRYRKIVEDAFRNDSNSPNSLDGSQVRELLKEVQAYRRNYVRTVPKIRVADGKTVEARCTNQGYCLTGMELVRQGGQTLFCPRSSQVETGFSASVRPMIAADRRSVRVNLQASYAGADHLFASKPLAVQPIPTLPPEAEFWVARGQSIPVLLFVDTPRLTKLITTRELIVPNGGTVLVGCWQQEHEVLKAHVTSALIEVPSINRRETDNILVMVTARILPHKAEKAAKAALAGPK